MTEPTIYEIKLRGNVGDRSLRPLIDDFSVDRSDIGVTLLLGVIRDSSQLHGIVTHLAAMHVEIIAVAPARPGGSAT